MNKPDDSTAAEQLIAVAINDQGTVSPHAGRAMIWQIYAVIDNQAYQAWDIHLTELGTLHEWHVRGDGNRHPVHSANIAIAGNAGDGVTRRLAERGTQLLTTTEQNPLAAVELFLKEQLPTTKGHDDEDCYDPINRKLKQSES